MADSNLYPGTPRWLKVLGIVALIVAGLFVTLQLTDIVGRHGPQDGHGGQGRPASGTEGHTMPGDHPGPAPHGGEQ